MKEELKQKIIDNLFTYVAENNTKELRVNIIKKLNNILERENDFYVKCDHHNNTNFIVDNNRVVVDVYLKEDGDLDYVKHQYDMGGC
jgi:hypothetical protein